MFSLQEELLSLSDKTWERFRSRIDGLSDDEYHWEPEPGCWGISGRRDGHRRHDVAWPAPDPTPFTTIAWRLWHVIDLYGENRMPDRLGLAHHGEPIGLDHPEGEPPATAATALALLDRAHERWRAQLASATDDGLVELIGPDGESYADRSRAAFVLHMLDEFIHHESEIALLRDLWRWQQPVTDDDLAERVIRGDRSVVPEAESLAVGTEWVGLAARFGRWELLLDLLDAGHRPAADGVTPLHRAAVAGELLVVQALVGAGADTEAVDPDFDATPLAWAQLFSHQPVIDWLEPRTG